MLIPLVARDPFTRPRRCFVRRFRLPERVTRLHDIQTRRSGEFALIKNGVLTAYYHSAEICLQFAKICQLAVAEPGLEP